MLFIIIMSGPFFMSTICARCGILQFKEINRHRHIFVDCSHLLRRSLCIRTCLGHDLTG